VDVGEYLEDAADAQVIAIAGDAIADLARPLGVFLEGFNPDEFTDLRITKHAHTAPAQVKGLRRPDDGLAIGGATSGPPNLLWLSIAPSKAYAIFRGPAAHKCPFFYRPNES